MPREWVYVQPAGERYVRNDRWKLTGTGELFDMKDAPFKELPVASDTNEADAKAACDKLKAVLDEVISQDKVTGDTPARNKNKDMKKQEKKKKKKSEAAAAAKSLFQSGRLVAPGQFPAFPT